MVARARRACLLWAWLIFLQPAVAQSHARLEPRWRAHITIEPVQAVAPQSAHALVGRIVYDEQHTQRVLAPFAGRVTQVFVQPGARVQKGTALLALSSPSLAALRAEQVHAELDVRQAQAALGRARGLLADGAVSLQDVTLAQATLQKAQAERARLEGHLQALSLELKGTGAQGRLVAQQEGLVTEQTVHSGQALGEGEPLLVVSDLHHVWVRAELFEQELAMVPQHGPIRVEAPALPNEHFVGELVTQAFALDASTRTLALRGVLKNPREALRPGMAAHIEVPLGSQGVWVARSAVLFDDRGAFVIVVGPDDVLERRTVRLGLAKQQRQQIVQGLAQNEQIIVSNALLVAQDLGL